jgi:hypothetical protein
VSLAAQAPPGSGEKTDPYNLCTTAIKNNSQDAYKSCKQYLDQSRYDDAKRLDYVKQWIAKYDLLLDYVKFLSALAPDPNAAWFVFEPDMSIQLPQTSETEGSFKIQISRSFADANEEVMLRRAESLYPNANGMAWDVLRSWGRWMNNPPMEMAPIWGVTGNDNIQLTNVLTARAVRYYYDLTMTARKNPHLPTGFTALRTNLKYGAVIKFMDQYSHKKDSFTNVYVADLTLEWDFTCGGLCGMGFRRNKVVVLDGRGSVLAIYVDAPMNRMNWVS